MLSPIRLCGKYLIWCNGAALTAAAVNIGLKGKLLDQVQRGNLLNRISSVFSDE